LVAIAVLGGAGAIVAASGWPGTNPARANLPPSSAEQGGQVEANHAGELGCRDGAGGEDILDFAPTVNDEQATRLTPTLDFDSMNGSARYEAHRGKIYYWGRAGSDDHDPQSGGVRVRWRTTNGPWHSCPSVLPITERGYVHTPAVATTIGGQAVSIQICLWRDTPYRENCTATIG
jgi:hypothetical protein